jgi:23S rRNA pseudouridine2605 synthase
VRALYECVGLTAPRLAAVDERALKPRRKRFSTQG